MFLAALLALQTPPAASAMIFFDSGSAEIRPEWQPVVQAAAAEAKTGRRLIVTGYSDSSGSQAANRRLSLQRAQAVAGALELLGVTRSEVEVRAAGEAELLVPTADGVREIQNRRVSITFAR